MMSNILHIFHKIHNYGVVGDRTVTFQSSLSTPWQVGQWSHSLMVWFGILGLLKELIFLLGSDLDQDIDSRSTAQKEGLEDA